MALERPHLLPLAEESFALEDVLYPVVDGKGCVRVKTNWYSTPLDAGVRAMVKVWPSQVEIFQDLECVARHQRWYGRGNRLLNLEHYLDVLEKKPGAMEFRVQDLNVLRRPQRHAAPPLRGKRNRFLDVPASRKGNQQII